MERPTRGPTRPPTGYDRNYALPQRFSARGRLFCVNTVSIVCAIKAPVPVRAEDGLDPLYLLVADVADGTDDVTELLTCERNPDCPHSQPPLAAEDNFNPECAKERLGPA